jgi:hypothetical protein
MFIKYGRWLTDTQTNTHWGNFSNFIGNFGNVFGNFGIIYLVVVSVIFMYPFDNVIKEIWLTRFIKSQNISATFVNFE